ncbi:MAG TPA: ACT domain-containing protein [bacterium]|nr:ACT domain-containing protein [bacterium]HOL47628.1 ACT domain-containing protein [bacterium]HPQ19618.1 ACT domain-containing protein [bacterium]
MYKVNEKQENLYVISAIGKDVTGLVSLFSSVIFDLNCNIVDVREDVVHSFFSILLFVDVSNIKTNTTDFVKRINEVAHQTGLKILIEKFKESKRKKEKKIMELLLLGKDKPGIIANSALIFGDYGINIEHIRMLARTDLFLMKMLVDISNVSDITIVQKNLKAKLNQLNVGVFCNVENLLQPKKRLVIFNIFSSFLSPFFLDSLIKNFNLSELKKLDERKIEISFNERRERFKKLDIDLINQLIKNFKIPEETEEVIFELKNAGCQIALVTNAFDIFTNELKERLRIDYVFSNKIFADDKNKIYEIEPSKINDIKNILLNIENLPDDDCLLIGDADYNDIFIPNQWFSIYFEFSCFNSLVKKYDLSKNDILNILSLF